MPNIEAQTQAPEFRFIFQTPPPRLAGVVPPPARIVTSPFALASGSPKWDSWSHSETWNNDVRDTTQDHYGSHDSSGPQSWDRSDETWHGQSWGARRAKDH